MATGDVPARPLPVVPRATAMPSYAPLFASGTETVSVRWATLTYPTRPEVLRAVLPAPLEAGAEPEVGVWVAEFIGAEFVSISGEVERRPPYMQGGVSVRCSYDGAEAAFAIATFVEGLNHGILGRELFGLPKKQAKQVTLDERGSSLQVGFTNARGTRLLETSVRLTDDAIDRRPAPEWFDNHMTHKLIPSAEGQGFDISRLVQIPWRFSGSRGTRSGAADVVWTEDSSDPLFLFAPRAPARADYGMSVLDIAYGTYRDEVTEFTTFGSPAW